MWQILNGVGPQNMKPTCQFVNGNRRLPLTDFLFQSGFDHWRGYSWSSGDEPDKFHNFSRQFLLESRREQKKEMIVFAFVMLTAAWPVIYMIISIVQLLL